MVCGISTRWRELVRVLSVKDHLAVLMVPGVQIYMRRLGIKDDSKNTDTYQGSDSRS